MTNGILLLVILLAGNWIYLIASDIAFRKRQNELRDRIRGLEAAQYRPFDEFLRDSGLGSDNEELPEGKRVEE